MSKTKESNKQTETLTTRNGSGLLVEALVHEDADFIFGYPGDAVLSLYDTFYDEKIEHILARHEQDATHAAGGYARVSGKPGVVVVTSSPGATNTITSITDAYCDSLPLVVFTGQVAAPGIGEDTFQEADLLSVTAPITKVNYQVKHVNDIPRITHEAFYLANTGRKGLVVIDFPKNMGVLTSSAPLEEEAHLPSYQATENSNKEGIQQLSQYLNHARKPVVLAGAGIDYSKSSALLTGFVTQRQIPVVTTLSGLGAISYENPLLLGMGGMHGSCAGNMAPTECDLLINLGSRFDNRLANNPNEFTPNAEVVRVDIDESEINKVVPATLGIVADRKKVLETLVTERQNHATYKAWVDHRLDNKSKRPFKYKETNDIFCRLQGATGYIGKIINGETIVTTDISQHQMWSVQSYPFKHHGQWVTSGGLGTTGFGIPSAIGAQLAAPDKTAVCFVGDGGFQMASQEMALLPGYHLNVKIILINSGTLGVVKQWQDKFFNQRSSRSVSNNQPDFIKMAEARGIKSFLIDHPNKLKTQLDEAFNYEGPTLIEIRISPAEPVNPVIPSGKANHEMGGLE